MGTVPAAVKFNRVYLTPCRTVSSFRFAAASYKRYSLGRSMKITATELLQRLPGKISEKWPLGERFAPALAHGSMSVELYAPIGTDPQTPHTQDELYFIQSGTGVLVIAGERHSFEPGACFFVAAGVEHKFELFSPDFSTWVVFWGPVGGESAA